MELATLIVLASRLMTEEIHRELADAGFDDLRPAHGFAFQLLASTGGATGVALAEHLGVSRQAANQMVDELEERGYVVRQRDPRDARLRRIVLTARGHDVLALSARLWADQERAWERLIGAPAMATLTRGLRAFIDERDGFAAPLRLRPTW